MESMVASANGAVAAGADLVELRLDWLLNLSEDSVLGIFRELEGIGVPKIATVMPTAFFGRYEGSREGRLRILMKTAEFAEYVDIGMEMGDGVVRECLEGIDSKGAKAVVSIHSDRTLTVPEVIHSVNSMPTGAVCKLVMPAKRRRDNLLALEASASLGGRKRIVFCHGSMGIISRVLCPLYGSEWTYASAAKGKEGAPGQIDVSTMRRLYEVLA